MKTYFTLIASVMMFHLAVAQNSFPANGDVTVTTGKIGITTTTPRGLLSLGGGNTNKKLLLFDNADDAAGFGMAASETRMFCPASGVSHISFGKYNTITDGFTEHMRIDNGGNVGIGTASPSGLLSTGSVLKNKKVLLYDNGVEAAGFGMSNYETRMFSPSSSTNHISFGKYTASSDLFEEHMRIENGGNVAIGTIDSKGHKLAVNGTIIATEVTVALYPWPDYVFHPEYRLRPLSEVESFIRAYHHLPEVPSAAEVTTNGVKVGETEALLLKKIEELTLYLIEKDKELQAVKQQLATQQIQQQQIDDLRHQVELLAKTLDKE